MIYCHIPQQQYKTELYKTSSVYAMLMASWTSFFFDFAKCCFYLLLKQTWNTKNVLYILNVHIEKSNEYVTMYIKGNGRNKDNQYMLLKKMRENGEINISPDIASSGVHVFVRNGEV